MTARFNPPPGWPPAPAGWTPPPGWSPDPSWPAPPAGWQLWVEDAPGAPGTDDVSRFSKPDPSSAPTTAMPTYQAPGAPGGPDHGAVPPSGPVPTGPGAAWSGSAEVPSWQQQGPAGPTGTAGPGGPGAFGGPGGPGGFGGPGGPGGFGSPDGPGGPQSSGSSGRQWLIPVIIALVAVGAIIAVLFATGVLGGSDEPDASPTSSAPTTSAAPEETEAPTEEPTDEPTTDDATDEPTVAPSDDASDEPTDEPTGSVSGDGGSRTSPLAPGETAPLGDWTVSFAATNSDAWAEISESSSDVSSFYEPADGDSYLMSPLTITYLGEGSEPLYMLDYVFVSSDGVTYKDKCGYVPLPNQLETGQELYTDATVTGNICITVPTDKIDGGVWRVSGWDRVNKDTEAFFALS